MAPSLVMWFPDDNDFPFPSRRPWEATWWVHFLQSLGPSFPTPDSPQDTWRHFMARSSTWPAVLLLMGVLATILVVLCSCICRPEAVQRMQRQKPSPKPTVCLGVMLLALAVVGTATCSATGLRAATTAQDQLTRAIGDVTSASDEGSKLLYIGDTMLGALQAVPPACPPAVRPQVQQRVEQVIAQVMDYQNQVQNYFNLVQPLPQQLTDVKSVGRSIAVILAAGLMAPMGLVAACCLLVLFMIACANTARCTGMLVRCMSCNLLAPVVLVVALAAAAQLEVGIVTSSFCLDVDTNTLAYIGHAEGETSTTYEVSLYYIKGQGSNPLMEAIDQADAQLQQVNQSMSDFGGVLTQYCPAWTGGPVVMGGLATAQDSLDNGRRLLDPTNVYPYYEQAVRQDACQTVVIGLGWLVLFQVAVGLVCLPCLAAWSNCYFKARAMWHDQRDNSASEHLSP